MNRRIHLTLSDEHPYALAFVVIEALPLLNHVIPISPQRPREAAGTGPSQMSDEHKPHDDHGHGRRSRSDPDC
jgi:hypothetical protein